MTEFRGRYFAFLGLLCAIWVAVRVGFLAIVPELPNATAQEPGAQAKLAPQTGAVEVRGERLALPVSRPCCRRKSGSAGTSFAVTRIVFPVMNVRRPTASIASGPPSRDALLAGPLPPPGFNPPLIPPAQSVAPLRRAQVYAYSFWREGSRGGALTSGAQYGGSQSGVVATYPLSRFAKDREEKLALLLRGAIAHDNVREREVAAGLRWRPSQAVPLTVNGERRFRASRPDAFAAYVASGVSEVRLPLEFRFEAFGQAGVVSGKGAGPFFDFLARTDRKVAQTGNAKLSAGAGIWGGGQDNARRVDVGPTARADVALGNANFRLSADWRFRVAGDASPANGPAVTLSTSF